MDPALEKVFEVPKALRASSVSTHYAVEKQERFIRVPFIKQVQLWQISLVRPRSYSSGGNMQHVLLVLSLGVSVNLQTVIKAAESRTTQPLRPLYLQSNSSYQH